MVVKPQDFAINPNVEYVAYYDVNHKCQSIYLKDKSTGNSYIAYAGGGKYNITGISSTVEYQRTEQNAINAGAVKI